MADYKEVRKKYEDEVPLYEKLVLNVKKILEEELAAQSVYATVSGRVKDPDSFAIKASVGSRYSDPLGQIKDKAGIRVIVPLLRQVEEVEAIIRKRFDVVAKEQKLEALAYDQAGYLGVHLETKLKPADVEDLGGALEGRVFEVQLRTIAQGAWAEVTHDRLYKPPAELPDALKRRIFRLVSLVELFDNEVEGFLVEAEQTKGFRESDALDPLVKEMVARFSVMKRPDRRLSLAMAGFLVPLYEVEPNQVYDQIKGWIDTNEQKLGEVFSAENSSVPLIHQPEILLLFERLENDADSVAENWPEDVPREWLDEAATAWGIRLSD